MEWTGDIRVSGFVGLFFLDSFGEIMDGFLIKFLALKINEKRRLHIL